MKAEIYNLFSNLLRKLEHPKGKTFIKLYKSKYRIPLIRAVNQISATL